MQRHRNFYRGRVPLALVALAIPAAGTITFADSVPESIRIQEQAEKAYKSAPVVPIERGNAHHRDVGKDGEGDEGGAYSAPMPAEPPPAAKPHNSNK